MQRLIFDETPFKYYMVKPNSGANIKYICFDENGERVYKGEGSVNFTAFYPYAKSRYKYLSEYNLTNIPEWKRDENDTDGFYKNLHEWEDTYMFKNKGTYDVAGTSILTYNAGDIETDFKLYVPFSANEEMTLTSVTNSCGLLTFFPITASGTDTHICLDSSTNLIEGIVEINDSYNKTGNLYNKFIQGGDFFKIPTGEDTLSINGAAAEKVEYDYLFL